jgi:Yip1-like protein
METRPGTDRGAGYDPSVNAPTPEKASLVEDFIDIFYQPSLVFARREKTGYGMPLLVISLLSAAFAFANRSVITQIMDAEFTRSTAKMLAANPRLTQEMLDKQRPIQEAVGMMFAYIGTPVFIFVLAVFVWLFAKVVSAKLTYGHAVTITTLAWIPRLLGALVTTIQVVLMDTTNVTDQFSLSLSPARFMDRDATNPKVYGFLGSLDIFSLWFLLLIGIGVATIGKVPRAKGFVVAGILFVLGLLPALLFR